jgi:AAA domain-containing protein
MARSSGRKKGPKTRRAGHLVVTPASRIKPRKARSAWDRYLPLGALTIAAGYQGLGKSTMLCKAAADISRGELKGDLEGKPSPVVLASTEDSASTTLIPRLIAAGADLDKVHIVSIGDETGKLMTIPDDVVLLEKIVRSLGARVLMLDPLLSFVDLDSHNEQKVRRALAPMARLADEADLAVLGLMHLNKNQGAGALTRIMGSTAFTALPRSVLLLGAEGDDETRLHLIHIKSNLTARGPSLACHVEGFEVEQGGETFHTSRFVIDGTSDATADDVLGDPESTTDRTAKDDARDWLIDYLRNGPVPAQTAIEAAKKAEIHRRTLYRAQKILTKQKRLRSVPLSEDGEDGRRRAWELVQEVDK